MLSCNPAASSNQISSLTIHGLFISRRSTVILMAVVLSEDQAMARSKRKIVRLLDWSTRLNLRVSERWHWVSTFNVRISGFSRVTTRLHSVPRFISFTTWFCQQEMTSDYNYVYTKHRKRLFATSFQWYTAGAQSEGCMRIPGWKWRLLVCSTIYPLPISRLVIDPHFFCSNHKDFYP